MEWVSITAMRFLREMQTLRVRLTVHGNELHVDAPSGVLKPEHRDALVRFKADLIEFIPIAERAGVLQALTGFQTWRTTKQIAASVNLIEEAVFSILESLRETGSVERDGGPIFIWKVTQTLADEQVIQRLERHNCLIAIDRQTAEAIPLFKETDRLIVQDVADVYKPSDINLTIQQRKDLADWIDHYERASNRH